MCPSCDDAAKAIMLVCACEARALGDGWLADWLVFMVDERFVADVS